MRRFTLLLLACVALLGLTNRSNAADKKLTIAVIPKGTTHEFWKSIHAGAIQASRELNVEILWKGPLREDDREEQIKVVEDMITRGVDGIVLAPLDDTALRAPVNNAVRSGIPVVIIDSDLKSDKYTSFVATDNYRGGKLGGQHLASLLGGKGKVAMLRYQEGSASTMNREQGFLDAIKEHNDAMAKKYERADITFNPYIQIVSANQFGGATTETAYKASENLLAPLKTKDGKLTIDGIFCPNESTTFGMLRALQDAGLAGKVRFVGFDASAKLVEALKNGEVNALVVQNPMRMGYLGVKTAVEHLRGQKVEKRVDTGVALVTRDNIADPKIKDVIEPDLDKWLK